MLDSCLRAFDRMIEDDHYGRIRRAYERVFDWEELNELPYVWQGLPPVDTTVAPGIEWPTFAYNDAFADREKMLLEQLRGPFLHYRAGDYTPLAIRAHYGTVILPNILGADYQLTETSLPWAHHLSGGRERIRDLVASGVPDLRTGLGGACLDMADYYREALAPYPNLARETTIYHPDLQGPFDVAHLLWGPDIFLALYDCPDLVHDLLALVTETYIAYLRLWKAHLGEGNAFTAHWSIMMRGGAMLRDDTAIMLSTAQYEEFVEPYDQQVLDVFGGAIHYCGRGDQFVVSMADSRGLYGLHVSQPELNDVTTLLRVAQENRLIILDLGEAFLPEGIRAGVTLRRSWPARSA